MHLEHVGAGVGERCLEKFSFPGDGNAVIWGSVSYHPYFCLVEQTTQWEQWKEEEEKPGMPLS